MISASRTAPALSAPGHWFLVADEKVAKINCGRIRRHGITGLVTGGRDEPSWSIWADHGRPCRGQRWIGKKQPSCRGPGVRSITPSVGDPSCIAYWDIP